MKYDKYYHLYISQLYKNKALNKELEKYKSNEKYSEINEKYSDLITKHNLLLDDNKKKENKIVDLEKELKDIKTELDEMGEIINDYNKMHNEIQKYIIDLHKTKEELHKSNKEIEEYKKEIEKLKELNKKYRKRAEMNSSNSSYPSSFDKLDVKRVNSFNSRIKSNNPIGGQIGHIHHPRKEIIIDEKETLVKEINDSVLDNDLDYKKTGRFKEKVLVDINIEPKVIKYKIYEYYNSKTKQYKWSSYPSYLKDELNYGNKLKTFIVYLYSVCNVSINNIIDLISSSSNNTINISSGFISNLIKNTANLTKEEINLIENNILTSEYSHFDLTTCNINGKNKNILNISSSDASLYYLKETKSAKDLDETLLSLLDNTLIHDHVVGFYKYGKDHQECLAHVIRYLKQAKDFEDKIFWHDKMLSFIASIIDDKKKNIETDYLLVSKRYDEIIEYGKEEYKKIEIPKYINEGKKLLKRMEKYKDNHLLFLKQDIPYTNNICERMLRGFKRKQKQAIVFRSNDNVESLCLILSIINTAKMNKLNPYFKILDLFNNNQPYL